MLRLQIFLIEEKKQIFQCIASKHQAYLEEYEIPLTQGDGKGSATKNVLE